MGRAANSQTEDWDWKHARRICLGVARRYTGSPHDAEDIAQEAALRAWRRRDSLRDGSRKRQWLAQITRNEALRAIAKEPIGRELLVEGLEPSAEDEELRSLVERADLRRAVGGLSAEDRDLLDLRYGQDLTQAAIAKRRGTAEGTVKVQLHRARAKLRRAMIDR